MKKFYEKLDKYRYIEHIIRHYATNETAKSYAKTTRRLCPNCDIHIRRGKNVSVKINCKADCWMLVAGEILAKLGKNATKDVADKLMEIIEVAHNKAVHHKTMVVKVEGREVYPTELLARYITLFNK